MKVIARAGVCSRRDAEKLIAEGRVALNGEKVLTPATRIGSNDVIAIDGVQLKEFDYVDIGSVIELTNVVPIIIKSLLFK